jgi:hypothetical protein
LVFGSYTPRSLSPRHAFEEGQGKGNATAFNKLASIDIPGFLFHGIVIAWFR